jgi:hypothetical protein
MQPVHPVGATGVNQEHAMNQTAAHTTRAQNGRGATARPMLPGITGRVTAKARWVISAAVALIAPLVLIAESASASLMEAVACVGNGSFMALAASANAFTMIP